MMVLGVRLSDSEAIGSTMTVGIQVQHPSGCSVALSLLGTLNTTPQSRAAQNLRGGAVDVPAWQPPEDSESLRVAVSGLF